MSTLPSELFERLDPPSGGLVKLRERIAREEERRTRRIRPSWTAAGMSAAAAASAAVLLLFMSPLRQAHEAPPAAARHLRAEVSVGAHPSLVALGLSPEPTEPITVLSSQRHRLAVRHVPLDTDEVIFYIVATTDMETDGLGSSPSGNQDVSDEVLLL